MTINVENNPFIKFVVGSGVVGSGVVGYRVVGGVTHSENVQRKWGSLPFFYGEVKGS